MLVSEREQKDLKISFTIFSPELWTCLHVDSCDCFLCVFSFEKGT